jgi:hypothetical protein
VAIEAAGAPGVPEPSRERLMQVTWRDLDRLSRRRRAGDGQGLTLTGRPRGHRMGGVSVARPNESLKPTGLMRRNAGTTPAMAAGGLARRSAEECFLGS